MSNQNNLNQHLEGLSLEELKELFNELLEWEQTGTLALNAKVREFDQTYFTNNAQLFTVIPQLIYKEISKRFFAANEQNYPDFSDRIAVIMTGDSDSTDLKQIQFFLEFKLETTVPKDFSFNKGDSLEFKHEGRTVYGTVDHVKITINFSSGKKSYKVSLKHCFLCS